MDGQRAFALANELFSLVVVVGVFRGFLFRKNLFSREIRWPLKRRHRGIGPDALKIGMAIESSRRSPVLTLACQWHSTYNDQYGNRAH